MIAVLIVLFTVFSWVAWRTIERVKVTGPVYHSIIESKDLIADVLPPPEYIIESYLLVRELVDESDPQQIDALIDRGRRLRREYDVRHEVWDETLPSGALRSAMVDRSYVAAIAFFDLRDQEFIPAIRRGDHERALTIARTGLRRHYEEHRRAIDETVRLTTARMERHEAAAAAELSSALTQLFALGVVVLLLAIGVGFVARSLARRLVSRMRSATAAAERVASGDLTVRVEAEGNDESSALLGAIRAMAESLESLVARVKRSSVELMSTATEFAATTASQEATAAGFGASSSQIAAAVKEISATSQELLATMEEVARVASGTADLADDGRASIASLDHTMRGLAGATAGIAGKLSTIRDKASDINVVVTTITKVADQTHLLSVNAAIEAEKAGENGLGFLVLAREIRRLADQTAVSTLNIEQIVRQMQTAVGAGVSEMERFTHDVQTGVSTAHDVGLRFAGIIERVQTLSRRFDEASEGMRSQNEGAKQIDGAMRTLTDGARHTAASVREFNVATEHLRDAISGLRGEITGFRVSE